jgi:hypothetical protein
VIGAGCLTVSHIIIFENTRQERIQVSSIMPIAGELVRIATAARGAMPADLAGLPTNPPGLTFPSTEFGGYLFFQKRLEDGLGCGFGLLLHLLDDAFALSPL